ncbi:MAG: redoxin family protein, partial [Candidatus Methylomirabilia bacterium]
MPIVQMPLHAVSTRRPTPARSVLLVAFCLGMVLFGRRAQVAAEEPPLGVGSPAPRLTFKDCRGAEHAIDWSTGRPKAAVLFFFDPQSPPCLMEMTFLDTLIARARDFGLAVYAIESRGRAPADINQSLERYCALYRDPSFAMAPDPSFRLGALFRVRRTPTTFLVDGSGAIALFREGFEPVTAVELTRNIERTLGQEAGFFSFALRSLGVSAQGETALLARLAARGEENDRVAPKALLAGDPVPPLEFVDLIGRSSRWEWPAPGTPARVVFFWGGLSIPDVEELAFLEKIYATAHDAGLDVLAVATGGLDAAHVQELMDRYRKYHALPSYHIVADPDARLGRIFAGDERAPRTYLVGADGVIVYDTAGFSGKQASTLAGKIQNLLRIPGVARPPR